MQLINDQEKTWLLNEKYNSTPTQNYYNECLLIDAGMPVAYIIGNIEFLGCHINLDQKPLIPRPETEYWVDMLIKQNQNIQQHKILDLFSGSGCIGIALGTSLEKSTIDFGEIDPKNILQIKKNIKLNNLASDTNVYTSNVFSNIPVGKYNIITANPPYIDRKKIEQVQSSVVENEDDHALFANQQGLEYIYQLIDESHNWLHDNGEVWIEFDSWQTELIDTYLSENQIWKYKYLKDQYQKNRVLVLEKN